MAIMVPDGADVQFKSRAERRIFNRFRGELSNDYYVLHSLGITRHPSKLIGETDFVVVGPEGVFFIEVKGGGVSCQEGVWKFTNKDGQTNTKSESPWTQAASGLVQVRLEIENVQGKHGLNFGYGVIFPDEVFLDEGPEIEPAVLWDGRDWPYPMRDYIQKIASHWVSKNRIAYRRDPHLPDASERSAIRKLLRPNVKSTYTLASELNHIESELVELTEEQSRAVRGMRRNHRSVVFGGAGTGKTLLALEEARRLADEGARVLLLCYNTLLGRHLAANIDPEKITATSVHEFFGRTIGKHPKLSAQLKQVRQHVDETDYFRRAYPDVFMDALVAEPMFEPYNALVLDEAQDLMGEAFINAFDLLLDQGVNRGVWHLFMDPNQNIYGVEAERSLAELLGSGSGQYDLTINCRNSLKVAVNSSVLSKIDVPLHRVAQGGYEKFLYYTDAQDLKRKLNALVAELLHNGVNRKDIIFLSPRRAENSILHDINLDYRLNDLAGSEAAKNAIDYCTMHAFKGLERSIVIAVDLEIIEKREKQLLLYCGLTRAKAGLVCCIPDALRKTHDELSAEFGRRLPGLLTQN
jgi:hypothetical protein